MVNVECQLSLAKPLRSVRMRAVAAAFLNFVKRLVSFVKQIIGRPAIIRKSRNPDARRYAQR